MGEIERQRSTTNRRMSKRGTHRKAGSSNNATTPAPRESSKKHSQDFEISDRKYMHTAIKLATESIKQNRNRNRRFCCWKNSERGNEDFKSHSSSFWGFADGVKPAADESSPYLTPGGGTGTFYGR